MTIVLGVIAVVTSGRRIMSSRDAGNRDAGGSDIVGIMSLQEDQV
jgi:hypothetical protein